MADPSWLKGAEEATDDEVAAADPDWLAGAEEATPEEVPGEPAMEAFPTGEMPAAVPSAAPTPAPSGGDDRAPGPRLPFESPALMSGLTGGWSDEIAAGIRGLFESGDYEQRLAEERARTQADIAAKPGVETIGRVYQGAAASALPGSSLPAMVAQGAALGGLTAAGESEATGLGGKLQDAQAGVVAGGGVTAALGGAGKALAPLGSRLLRSGAVRTAEGIGATPTELKKMAAKHGGLEQLGESMRQAGITGSPGQMAERARAVQEAVGSRIGDIYTKADEAVGGAPVASMPRVRTALQDKLDELSQIHGTEDGQKILRQALKRVDKGGLSPAADATIPQMHKHVKSLAEGAQKRKFETGQRRAADAVADAYRQELQSAVGSTSPEILQELQEANKLFSISKSVIPAAEGEVARLGTGKSATLREIAMGGLGVAATGNPLAAAAALADKPLRKFGKAALAATERGAGHAATGLGRAAQRSPGVSRAAGAEAGRAQATNSTDLVRSQVQSNPFALGTAGVRLAEAAEKGDHEFAAEHWRLMMQDADYREKLRGLEDKHRKESDK